MRLVAQVENLVFVGWIPCSAVQPALGRIDQQHIAWFNLPQADLLRTFFKTSPADNPVSALIRRGRLGVGGGIHIPDRYLFRLARQPGPGGVNGDRQELGRAGRHQPQSLRRPIPPPHQVHIRLRSLFHPVQEPVHFRLDDRLRVGLRPSLHVGRQQQGGLLIGGAAFLWKGTQGTRPRIHCAVRAFPGKAQQLLPSGPRRIPVNGVGALGIESRRDAQNPGRGRPADAGREIAPAVQAAQPLPEAVHRRAFGDQGIETEIGPHLDRLGGHHRGHILRRGGAVRVHRVGEIIEGSFSIQGAHPSGDQVGPVSGVLQRPVDGAGGAHPVDHHSHRPHLLGQFFAHYLENRRRKGFVRRFGFAGDLPNQGLFGGRYPFAQLGAGLQVGILQNEPGCLRFSGGGRHFHHLETPGEGPAVHATHILQSFRERPAQMHLVQNYQAVVSGQAGVDGAHFGAHPVTPEQQTGAELIHGRHHHPGQVGTVRPLVVDGNTAPQGRHAQRLLLALRFQAGSHPAQDIGVGASDLVPD